jgi:hypothetical protein
MRSRPTPQRRRSYDVERGAADAAPQDHHATRQARPVLLLARLEEVREGLGPRTLPKAPPGDALRYLDQQWAALPVYLTDGHLLIDNNNAERQLRTVAVGRKNLLCRQLRRRPPRPAPVLVDPGRPSRRDLALCLRPRRPEPHRNPSAPAPARTRRQHVLKTHFTGRIPRLETEAG